MKTKIRLGAARSAGSAAPALCAKVVIAWPATLSAENPRITPLVVQNGSSPSLPQEIQSLESRTHEAGNLIAVLDAPTEVRAIKISRAVPYSSSTESDAGGVWRAIGGLRFRLASAAGGSAVGLKDTEAWSKGGRANIKNGAALLAGLPG